MSRRAKALQAAVDAAPAGGVIWTVEMVAAAVGGRKVRDVTREGEDAIVFDFGRHGSLTVYASLDWESDQQIDGDLDVLDRLDVGAVADLDLT